MNPELFTDTDYYQVELFTQKKNNIVLSDYSTAFDKYIACSDDTPLLIAGDSLAVLKCLPSETVDFVMTSPPYWGKREYENGGIGLESDFNDYIKLLADICLEVKRVLKSTGSFWLNLGDTYSGKNLLGIPWRVALHLTDHQGWVLRNSVIWNKLRGGDG